jgi:hypothetical protein
MDRSELRRLLTATEQQIAQREILIQNQRWRIEQLRRDGQDEGDAQHTLRDLLQAQLLQEEHRARLTRSLEEAAP